MSRWQELAAALGDPRFSHHTLNDDTGVLLDLQGLEVLALNATGELVVHQLQAGLTDTGELVGSLLEAFDAEEAAVRSDLEAFSVELADYLLTSPKE